MLSLADFRAPTFSLSVTRDDVGLEDEFELFMQLLGTSFKLLRCSCWQAPPDLTSNRYQHRDFSVGHPHTRKTQQRRRWLLYPMSIGEYRMIRRLIVCQFRQSATSAGRRIFHIPCGSYDFPQMNEDLMSLSFEIRRRYAARARVEHAFHVVKRLWGFSRVRYRGLAKNTARLYTSFALANLYLLRRRLLPPRWTCA